MKMSVSPLKGFSSPSRRAFQRAHAGGADGDYPAAAGPAGGNRVHHVLADLQPFAVHHMVLDTLDTHRLEGTGADMQGNEGGIHPFARIASSSASSKCRPAVGAATAPARWA